MPSEMLLLPAPPARTPRSAWRWLPGMKYRPESQNRAGAQSQQPLGLRLKEVIKRRRVSQPLDSVASSRATQIETAPRLS